MIWFLLVVVAIVIAGVLCWNDKISDLGFLMTFFFSLSVSLIITVLIGEFLSDNHLIYEKENEWDIVALQDDLIIQGRTYFLRSGYIETDLNYYYLYKTSNGMKVGHIPATECYINYSGGNPHIEKYKSKWDNDSYLWITLPSGAFNFIPSYYKIYIPEGSIAEDYNINLS